MAAGLLGFNNPPTSACPACCGTPFYQGVPFNRGLSMILGRFRVGHFNAGWGRLNPLNTAIKSYADQGIKNSKIIKSHY
jgi:hypothetical protein